MKFELPFSLFPFAFLLLQHSRNRFLSQPSSPSIPAAPARKAAVLKTSFDAAPEAIDLPPGIGLSVGCVEVPRETKD